jgi:CheY-like chemotaxis protein
VPYAENGRAGIDLLQADPEIEIVLMDIMMPEMDGLAAMRAIRNMPRFASLPIIAIRTPETDRS